MKLSQLGALLLVFTALPAQAWDFQLAADPVGEPLILFREQAVVIADGRGRVHCLSTTGSLKWWYRANAPFSTGPVRLGKRQIAIGSENGHVYLFDLQGNRHGKVDVHGIPSKLLPRADGGLFVAMNAAHGRSQIVSVSDTRVDWTQSLTAELSAGPTLLSQDGVVAGTTNGILQAFDLHGLLLWKTKLDAPLVGAVAKTSQGLFAADTKGQVQRFDFGGTRIWRRDYGVSPWGVMADSTGATLLVSSKDDLVALHADGRQAWRRRLDSPLTAAPIGDSKGWLVLTTASTLHRISYQGLRMGARVFEGRPQTTPRTVGSDLLVTIGRQFHSLKGPVGAVDPRLRRMRERFARVAQAAVVWRRRLSGRGTAGVVMLDSGDLAVATRDDHLLLLDPHGKPRWRYRCDGTIGEPPARLANGGVVFVCGADLHLVDGSGNMIHQLPLRTGSRLVPRVGTKSEIVVASGNELLGLGPKGKVVWRVPTKAPIEAPAAFGVGEVVYVGSSDAQLYALHGGKLLWSRETGGSLRAAPTITSDNEILVPSMDQHLYALDGHTGRIRWRYQADGQLNRSPVFLRDGTIIIASMNGGVTALSKKGRLKWRFQTEGKLTTPAVLTGNGNLAIGTDSGLLFALDEEGKNRWWIPLDAPPIGPIAHQADGSLIVVTREGSLWKILPPTSGGRASSEKASYLGLRADGPITRYSQTEAVVAGRNGTLTILERQPQRLTVAANTTPVGPPPGKTTWVVNQRRKLGIYPLNAAAGGRGHLMVSDSKGNLSALYNGEYRYRLRLSQVALSPPEVVKSGREQLAIVGSANGQVWAIDPRGEIRWRIDVGKAVRYRPTHRDTQVAIAAGNVLVVVDLAGKKLWRHQASASLTTAPSWLNDLLVIGDGRGKLTALSTVGKVRWQRQLDAAIVELRTSPHQTMVTALTATGEVVTLTPEGQTRYWPALPEPARSVAWIGPTAWVSTLGGALYRIEPSSSEVVREYPTVQSALQMHALPGLGALVIDRAGRLHGLRRP